jgi:hypothetical protein
MLKNIIQLLQLNDHYGVSENIEIAKGKNELPKSFKQGYRQIKRELKWQSKNK